MKDGDKLTSGAGGKIPQAALFLKTAEMKGIFLGLGCVHCTGAETGSTFTTIPAVFRNRAA